MVNNSRPGSAIRNEFTWGGSGIEFEVVEWILNHTALGDTVVEFGAGDVSTAALGALYEKFYSVETDCRWLHRYEGVRYIHAPSNSTTGWYESDILRDRLPKDAALYLIDGPFGNRERILDNCDLFNRTAYFVFHDTDRAKEADIVRAFMEKIKLNELEHYQNFEVVYDSSVR